MADRKTQNPDAVLIPGEVGGMGRNARGRVFFDDAEPFEVVVRTPTDETVMARGVGQADAGTMCALYLTLRAEANVRAPAEAELDPESAAANVLPRLE